MAATFVLLIFRCVALRAVERRHIHGQNETLVIHSPLAILRAVTVVACHVCARVFAHRVLVHDRGGFLTMTLGAFARRTHVFGARRAACYCSQAQ